MVEGGLDRRSTLEPGCTVAQGYYLSRPVPPGELRDRLRARRGVAAGQA